MKWAKLHLHNEQSRLGLDVIYGWHLTICLHPEAFEQLLLVDSAVQFINAPPSSMKGKNFFHQLF